MPTINSMLVLTLLAAPVPSVKPDAIVGTWLYGIGGSRYRLTINEDGTYRHKNISANLIFVDGGKWSVKGRIALFENDVVTQRLAITRPHTNALYCYHDYYRCQVILIRESSLFDYLEGWWVDVVPKL